jgi:hypothetical protein
MDALKNYQFPKNKGLFMSFSDGDEYKLRVLTTDPMVTTKEFTGADGAINLSTRFAFVVYNFTLEKAQILNAGATITKAIQKIHQDKDYGADIQKVDIKITATGNQLSREYTVNVLPKTETLTKEQIAECRAINLDDKIEDGQRMSFYNPEEETKEPKKDVIIEDIDDNPIDLNEIPF